MKCQHFPGVVLEGCIKFYNVLKIRMAPSYLCLKAKQEDKGFHSLILSSFVNESMIFAFITTHLNLCHDSHYIEGETVSQRIYLPRARRQVHVDLGFETPLCQNLTTTESDTTQCRSSLLSGSNCP